MLTLIYIPLLLKINKFLLRNNTTTYYIEIFLFDLLSGASKKPTNHN